MTHFKVRRLFCLWFLLLIPQPDFLAAAEQQTPLRFNWQAGKRYIISLETATESAVANMPPGVGKSVQTEKREFVISVPKPGQSRELTLVCRSTKYEMKGDTAYTFDSADDPKTEKRTVLAAEKRAFVGTAIKYYLDPDLQIMRVEGTAELAAKFVAHDPSLKNDLSTPMITEAKFGTNALAELLQQLMVVGLPKKILVAGNQWTQTTEHRAELTVAEAKLTLAGLEKHLGHDCARIEIGGEIKSGSDRGKLPPGIPMPKVQGNIKGTLWVGTKLEMLVERTMTEETSTEMTVPAVHGKEGQTFQMKMNQKKTVTCRLLTVEDN